LGVLRDGAADAGDGGADATDVSLPMNTMVASTSAATSRIVLETSSMTVAVREPLGSGRSHRWVTEGSTA
jgi:hypothetical protein